MEDNDDSEPEMIWEDENYKFVVTPRWILKKRLPDIEVVCYVCNGACRVETPESWHLEKCERCNGSGKILTRPEYPPTPKMNQKFLDDLKSFIQNYGK